MAHTLNIEAINSLIETQLECWPLARNNFDALIGIDRRKIRLGDFEAFAQHNPARIRSTAARVDAGSVQARPCFLCSANRPEKQISFPWLEGWELLLNPYPILPVHFTIASTSHCPQDHIPPEMAAMAEMAPDLVFFFNGAKAGASAPDHLHVQAVLKSEVPLIDLVERFHTGAGPQFMRSSEWNADLPFHFYSAVITPDAEGMRLLRIMTSAKGLDSSTGLPDADLVNAFFWIGRNGLLRIVVIPRAAHRPECFSAPEPDKMLISPGALDMAGLVITPRREDFDRLSPELLSGIYAQVAFADSI